MAKRSTQRTLAGFDAAEPPAAENQPAPPPPVQHESLAGKKVYVVDAHPLIYQVFHVVPPMTAPNGKPVAAIHGFVRDMVYLLEQHKPDYLFVAFDFSGKTFRHDKYEKYKANREEMPVDLRSQMLEIRRMLRAMNIPVLELENYEADDILATLARIVEERGGKAVLVTSDKDCRQLISDNVKIFNIRKNQMYDAAALLADWGVRPDQVVDFQALVGDSTDQIPGIPLIGPKIAKELLETYGTLDNVLDHASEVSGKKRRENLENGRAMAELCRELARLEKNTPIEIDWAAGAVSSLANPETFALCEEYGFRRLADQLKSMAVNVQAPEVKPPVEWIAKYEAIVTPEQLAALVAEMAQQQRIVIDTETTAINPRLAEIVGYSFAWKEGEAYYIPVRAPKGEPQLDPKVTLETLRPVLENPAIEKIGQNLKYDMIVLRGAGVELAGVAFDTMVADYLLDPGQRNHNMDDMAARYLNHKTIKISELIGTGKNQKRMDEVPVAQVAEYAAEDADVPLRLKAILEPRLTSDNLDTLFRDLEMPLIRVLAEMEYNGVKIDIPLLKKLSDKHAVLIHDLEEEIYDLAGYRFNIDSRQQLGKVLFDELNLPVAKKTKSGPSTDVEVLTELAKLHKFPAKVIEYRQNAKLKSTYIDALPLLAHPGTGRVHTSFMQDVAATGRLSSKDPNLQNIPIRTEAGREIRSAFVAPAPDWRLLAADYSQIELRVLAHFSGDATLQAAFARSEDIHTRVAAEVYKTPLEQVTSDQRRSAKTINFGIIYGQSPFGLAKSLDIDKEQAAEFIEAYFAQYPGVGEFMENVLAEALKNGYVTTILGRRRAIEGVRKPHQRNSLQRNTPERIAINTVIQGSAADLIKQAMINIYDRLAQRRLRARMLLQIHDELVFEAPLEEIAELAELARVEMTQVGNLRAPLAVDVKAGPNWAACEPLPASA